MDNDARSLKQTRRWVLIADKVADKVITVGGIGVIVAVLGMLVFLIFEVLPLFHGGTVDFAKSYTLPTSSSRTMALSMDEYLTMGAALRQDGSIALWHAKSGAALQPLMMDLGGKKITAFSSTLDNSGFAVGFEDGSVQFGRLKFSADIIEEADVPEAAEKLNDAQRTDGTAIYTTIPGRRVRKVSAAIELDEPVTVSDAGKPIIALDYHLSTFGERPKRTFVTVDADGVAQVSLAESKLNLMTGASKTTLSKVNLPPIPGNTPITKALVNDAGEEAFFVDANSTVHRFNLRASDNPVLAESVRLTPDGVRLTTLGFLTGQRSLVVGGSDGSVSIYFLLRNDKAPSKDGYQLVKTREFEPQTSPVTAFAATTRGKTFATGDESGNVLVRHGTSQATLLRLTTKPVQDAPPLLMFSPRMDGLIDLTANTLNIWGLNIPHPEVSFKTLFGKVWYEGYSEPGYTWQSTGATDEFEPKMSLVPLIFGTVKATVYSLLFAIPIALLSAIYTSEFLPLKVRSKVKPVMEIMASIPSVVLGFVAALVLSPIVETWIAAILLAFFVGPVTLIVMAFLWQLLPPTLAVKFDGVPKFLFMFVVLIFALYLAYRLGPLFEHIFFAGNFTTWVTGAIGGPAPFLFLMNLPVIGLLVSWLFARYYNYRFRTYILARPMPYSALLDLSRWLGLTIITLILSYISAKLMTWAGLDPRKEFMGSYVQRNTLIVGFAMGFAVIPLIYTLAEDALSSVPEHLRSASLGCGATPWQTAKWIILPTAISGVFSAIMIGMGRAVGETMIVVMSAGNTPLIDWNIFNGLRALSANIAVELPEAPKDGSLYRVLFLTGLVLFSMTFVINTIAELVRIHFRKRATQL